jgi:hypothetical protein
LFSACNLITTTSIHFSPIKPSDIIFKTSPRQIGIP